MVVYDLENRLPAFTITQLANNASRQAITSVTVYQGRIYAVLRDERLYSAPVDFPNLSDPFIWQQEHELDGLPVGTAIRQVGANSQAIYARVDNTVYVNEGNGWEIDPIFDEQLDRIFIQENARAGVRISRTTVVAENGSVVTVFFGPSIRHTLVYNNTFYLANGGEGLGRFENNELQIVTPGGPITNNATRVVAHDGEVYVAPKGFNSFFGSDPDGTGIYYRSPETGWTSLRSANGKLPPNRVNTGFARGHFDKRTGTAYMASWGKGFLSLKNGELQNFWDCGNSPIGFVYATCDTTFFDNTRVSGLDTDRFGNLWISVDLADRPLQMLTPEGEWFSVPKSKFSSNHFIDLIADDVGNKWLVLPNSGMIVYNDNGTPTDLEDDRVVRLSPIRTNLDDKCDPSNDVRSVAIDQEGFVWVGTGRGVVVYANPFAFAQGEVPEAGRPVFNERCLLENEVIYSIAVDGGNRKWFGTDNGVFLMNENGEELIEYFTAENSPLLSNKVTNISIDQITGEVYFSTDRGLISYLGDATEGTATCDDVYVYPNPVFTDYEGDIVIQGSAFGATVKIVTVSGLLVRELQSQGGTTVWDGRDIRGEKVHSGVYLAMMADDDGENGCIGKFVVIRR